ncbi:efflux RND transporter periplasmic adaptor subunit [Leptospira borgpetersenii]|uniref:HlyD family secretion domain protein n=1 Tax=Leptospira borgpetersenii serovar Ballum TaxID=280505 RepID=A0A0E3B1A9_LEPBO|nr:efflux RND transporter periplasmic adaptor subunit [Leptospira borgpetersenii]EMO11021.1 HlyD family secretion domain protein [Leptospira borgpetersenii str. Noumea 25]ALO25643.1 HlyD family secretion domain protein [Leptospira borgpetersenii serovar Ballum]ANH00494.1 HlyD family secretion domain protein [Leptospira borgpetersenii str. 4E]EKR00753.1 HlyD family secretion domain protein [Leptospira borgpetersenii serovar Castellonis str. 200801910]KGE24187.1 membrane protein [Leptospira borg
MKKKILLLTALVVLVSVLALCKRPKGIYYCPMHPTYSSDRPGTCPICNMDLVPKTQENREEHGMPDSSQSSSSGAENGESGEIFKIENIQKNKNYPSPELKLSLEKQQSIGIRTETVQRRNLEKKISAYSTVAYDPDLYTALTEYKELLRARELLSDSSLFSGQNPQIRLRQLGLSTEQIRLWTSGKRDPSELILGGKSGRAHIYSQIYEPDLSVMHVGLKISFRTNVYPDTTFSGRIASIDTILDKNNRTLRLRSEVFDKNQILKPQMFGDLEIDIPLKNVLSVPSSAVLDTGMHKTVYVQTGPDRFVGVPVKTGASIGSWIEIREGLKEGQTVVVESTFLLDSEAKIRFGFSGEDHKH